MADLNERGQIILISAFILAVTFVALALVVNSAIFTENLASRGEVSGSSEALVYQHQVEQSVGEAMAFANRYNYSTPTLEESVKASISDIGTRGGIQQARGGQLANVSFESSTPGTRIADNQSGGSTFENESGGESDWRLADDVTRTRNFVITVTNENALEDSGGSSPFTVEANDTSTTESWSMELFDDGSEVEIAVSNADGDPAKTCSVTVGTSNFKIDVTNGIVNGERCHALSRSGTSGTPMWFGAGIGSDYDISFENGDQIEGNYSLVISPRSSWNSTNLRTSHVSGYPFRTDAIYSANLKYVYVTPNVGYETKVRVAPGEPPS